MAFTITYEYPTTESISAVKIDGVSATQRSSASGVESNPGSFYNDSANSLLYVSASTGSVFGKSVVAVASLKYATDSKVFNGDYYDPRISSVPKLSMRIEKEFGGVGQISAGSLDLLNLDGEFDSRANYLWDNSDSKVTLKLGYDERVDEMIYASYSDFGVWAVESWKTGDTKFSLNLKESKTRLDTDIPFEAFDTTTYSGMDEDDVGEPIPRAYGKIYGARPILINSGTKTFKVANHAIKSLDDIRLKISDVWTTSTFTTTDLDNGEFTCSAWADGYEVAVDFKGRKNADGDLMDNAAQIVEDLLTYAGVPSADLDSTAFNGVEGKAYKRLNYGVDNFGIQKTVRGISLYLDELTPLVDVIGQINEIVGSYLFVNASGKYYYGVFEPTRGNGLSSYDSTDTLDFIPEVDSESIVSKIFTKYAHRRNDDWWQLATVERTANQYDHNVAKETIVTSELPELSLTADAQYWAQRKLVSDGLPLVTYQVTLPAKGLSTLPGDQIRVENARRSFNQVLEVLEVDIDLSKGMAKLLCGNLRNWGQDNGFWSADAPTLEDGVTAASPWSAAWTDDQKTWAKQNIGYWTDANGFADPADPDSFIPSTWF